MKTDLFISKPGEGFQLHDTYPTNQKARLVSRHLLYSNRAKTCLLIDRDLNSHEYLHKGCML